MPISKVHQALLQPTATSLLTARCSKLMSITFTAGPSVSDVPSRPFLSSDVCLRRSVLLLGRYHHKKTISTVPVDLHAAKEAVGVARRETPSCLTNAHGRGARRRTSRRRHLLAATLVNSVLCYNILRGLQLYGAGSLLKVRHKQGRIS